MMTYSEDHFSCANDLIMMTYAAKMLNCVSVREYV